MRIVVMGGGTGTFAVLSGLKHYPVTLSAIITMMDSGGSTGRLRDQYGVLPPGDVRQALVALSDSDKLWRELFVYRFKSGDLKGHTFGNLILMALETISGTIEAAIERAQQILHTKGTVIPVTLKKTHIEAELENGTVLTSEKSIDTILEKPIKTVRLTKQVKANPKAVEALLHADAIIVGPGDVYTSIVPNFLFPEINEAYKQSRAKKIFVANLMNKHGQTDGFTLEDYIRTYEYYMGKKPFSQLLCNSEPFPPEMASHYKEAGETPVVYSGDMCRFIPVTYAPLLSSEISQKVSGDTLKRSIARHDPAKLAQSLLQLLHE